MQLTFRATHFRSLILPLRSMSCLTTLIVLLECTNPVLADVKEACLAGPQNAYSILDTCRKFIATNPSRYDLAAAHYNRGVSYLALKILYLAWSEFDQAISADPTLYAPWAGRAEVYLRSRKLNLAQQDIDKALSIDPNRPDGQDIRALIARDFGDTDQLLDASEKEIKLRPNDAEGYERRGEAHQNSGDIDSANADFLRATLLNSTWAYAWARLGTSYAMKGDSPHALKAYNKALSIDAMAIEALVNRGKLEEDAGEPEKASLDYRAALARASDLSREQHLQKEALDRLMAIMRHVPRAEHPVTTGNSEPALSGTR